MAEGEAFDEAFVNAAAVREDDLRRLPKPSRASLREVKREARERRRAARPPRRGKGLVVLTVLALGAGGAGYAAVSRRDAAPRAAERFRGVPVVVPSYTPPATRPADPFSGTAVAHWPVGAAGIRPPAPVATGRYTQAQVADAYARTAAYLKAAMLDRRVLWDGDMKPVYATLSPSVPRAWKGGEAHLATRFWRDVRPASPAVRVNGTMTAKVGTDGFLAVEFVYVGTYALRPADGGSTELVAIRRSGLLQFERAAGGRLSAAWADRSTYLSDHSDCTREWEHPRYVEVYLGRRLPGPSAPPESMPTYDVTDPRAGAAPKGCFDNTGKL